jgi:isoaspartyl peptidase/L-asparaginase-like protein (Ntn-hydrolase superfamily)
MLKKSNASKRKKLDNQNHQINTLYFNISYSNIHPSRSLGHVALTASGLLHGAQSPGGVGTGHSGRVTVDHQLVPHLDH